MDEKGKNEYRMSTGLVLGKFMPLHKGHLALIDFASRQCNELIVLLCYTPEEEISGQIRQKWLHQELVNYKNVTLHPFEYDEQLLPNTSVSSEDASKKWALVLKEKFPHLDLIFSSERYGDYLASYFTIKHIPFDIRRTNFPISSSLIRKSPFRYWDFIADRAKPYFVKKIALLGSESTGKSTLAKKLADRFDTEYVPEVAREIVEKTDECSFEHLTIIAERHAKKILEQLETANKLLFLDTDLNITRSYANFLFNKHLVVDSWIEDANRCNQYLFLDINCPYMQDGTRLNEKEREKLNLSHINQLKLANISYTTISGNWEERFNTACDLIGTLYLQ